MKKSLVLFLFIPVLIYSQYNFETANEKGFEQSPVQFNSHFLNPFGIYYFKDITPGLINDPFLNLFLNPANIPDIGENDFHFYLDFRGDRTESKIVENYAVPVYTAESMDIRTNWIDPRYIVETRTEPEPIVSFGFITFPVSEITRKFFVAATYQIISRNENYYDSPYYLYSPRASVDAFNEDMPGYENIPVQYGYYGIDEMLTTSHLFSFFTGYEFVENLSMGIGLNAVIQKRAGDYGNNYSSPVYYEAYNEYYDNFMQSRTNKYNHLDWNVGVNYNITPRFTLGLKVGLLNGKAEQDYLINALNKSEYDYGTPEQNYYKNIYFKNSEQSWDRDGNTKYVSLNFRRQIDESKTVKGYYRFTDMSVDLSNSSTVFDTTNYESAWFDSYSNKPYYSLGRSFLSETRTGKGEKSSSKHEVMLNFDWVLSDVSHLMIGVYYYNTSESINSSEPVIVNRSSSYKYTNPSGNGLIEEYKSEFDDKVLDWKSDAVYWSFQIPIIMQFTLSENWGLIFGLNRILNSWEITDETTAYFKKKITVEGTTKTEKENFGEKYVMPAERISDDATRFFGGIEINITDALSTKIMFEPEFENEFRIAQWWLSFGANL